MANPPSELTGPDLALGIPLSALAVGAMLTGHAHGDAVMLVRRADSIVAIGAYCSHYGVSLQDGVLNGDKVRCPLHHACFNVDTGDALHAPAFDPLPRWAVEIRDGMIFVTTPLPAATIPVRPAASHPARIVIIGGGAAGDAAAGTLRHEGYRGTITMLSADRHAPPDRPNFSKGTISGTVTMAFNFVRLADFYHRHDIDLRLDTTVASIDTALRVVHLTSGDAVAYDALLLATGAEPIRLAVPGAELPHVRTLRSLDDSLEIAALAANAKSVVVVGASFIGLETAAALRALDLDVHVVAPDDIPMARVLGDDIGRFMQRLHERHGVTFHLGTTALSIEPGRVQLANGDVIAADLVITGIGVRPSLALAEKAGLAIDNGVLVNAQLETSIPGVFAAGDIARWLDESTGKRTRVEHWVVAQRQGQTVARNMLGAKESFTAVPFFWTEHYGVTLLYVGHAERGFTSELTGSLATTPPDARVDYRENGRLVAVATIGRDRANLEAELAFERARAALAVSEH